MTTVESSLLEYKPGTYSRNAEGQTTITVQNHGLDQTDTIYVKYTTGGARSQVFHGVTLVSSSTFQVTVNTPEPLDPTEGQVLVSRLVFNKSGTYTIDSLGILTVNIPSHGYLDGTDLYLHFLSGPGVSSPVIIESIVHTGSFRVVKKNNPGGFYSAFGVSAFHEQLHYGAGVKVYVIDQGFNDVDLTAPGIQPTTDLADFIMVDLTTPGAGGGGYSHGGLVCALLGASRRNGAGIIGVCPDAQLFIADVDDDNGAIFITRVVEAIDDAISRGVDIINMSLGTTTDSPILRSAIQRALLANILVFASSGNSGREVYEFPASYPGVIAVSSVNIQRKKSTFNTTNDRVDLFAPGEGYPLPSPLDIQDVVYVNGTSFSTPFAAGLAALYLSRKRKELDDPLYRCSPDEMISVLGGVEYLHNAAIIPQQTSSASGMGVAVLLVLALVVGIAVFPRGNKGDKKKKKSL